MVDKGLPARLLSAETKQAIYDSFEEASKVKVSRGIDAIRILSDPASGVAAPSRQKRTSPILTPASPAT